MTAQKQPKLKWTDTEEIAFRLIDKYPDADPLKVRFTELHKYVLAIPGFSDDPKKSNEKILEAIQMTWLEERQDMVDELGPISGGEDDDDTLDEDDYSDERMTDDEDESDEDNDEDEDEDEFGDGFQEEEIED